MVVRVAEAARISIRGNQMIQMQKVDENKGFITHGVLVVGYFTWDEFARGWSGAMAVAGEASHTTLYASTYEEFEVLVKQNPM